MNKNIDCFLVQGNFPANVHVDLHLWLKMYIHNLRLKFFSAMRLQYLLKQTVHGMGYSGYQYLFRVGMDINTNLSSQRKSAMKLPPETFFLPHGGTMDHFQYLEMSFPALPISWLSTSLFQQLKEMSANGGGKPTSCFRREVRAEPRAWLFSS